MLLTWFSFNSNNIQDRVNMEMMTHIEGPIVDSFFDMALLSWDSVLTPPLPSLISRPPVQTQFDFGNEHKFIQMKDIEASKVESRAFLKEHQEEDKAQQQDQKPNGPCFWSMSWLELSRLILLRAKGESHGAAPLTSGQAPTTGGADADENLTAEAANVQRTLETPPGQSTGGAPLTATKSGRMAAVTAHLSCVFSFHFL